MMSDLQREHNQTTTYNNGSKIQRAIRRDEAKIKILIADFLLSFMWVCSNSNIDLIINRVLGFANNHIAQVNKCALKVANLFLFAVIGDISGDGGSYNPLTVLADAISADFNCFLFTLSARIPAQVLGSILGVKLLMSTFSDVGKGPKLNVEIHQGALIEGVLAFIIAIVSMVLARSLSGSFYRRNWIFSISKISLQVLCYDLTGACMNPATAMGWAYARGDHMTKEHIVVYWLAPVEATLAAVWLSMLLFWTEPDEKMKKKTA